MYRAVIIPMTVIINVTVMMLTRKARKIIFSNSLKLYFFPVTPAKPTALQAASAAQPPFGSTAAAAPT